MPLWRFLALLFIGVTGMVVLTVWYFPSTADFRSQNPFWNGLERFGARYEVTPLASLEDLPQSPVETMLVVIPYLEPNQEDLERLKSYTEGGGTLILADDWGFGNSVLEGLGVSARFVGAPLLDPLFNHRNRWFPMATELAPSPLTADVSVLALNYATTLEGSAFTIVARSSAFSYLDFNGDGVRDSGEPVGPFPVIGHTQVGDGQLVLLSDPSLLINTMLNARDNAQFVENLVGLAGPEPRVFLDQAHLPPSRLDETKGALGTIRKGASNPVALAGLIVALTIIILAPLGRRKGASAWTKTS